MNKWLNLDSPLMTFLSKMADLMLLNILVVICSLPIVTAGASFTAMHYVCLKIVRDEECYIAKDFFKSFKLNFKQATGIWLIMLAIILVYIADYYLVIKTDSVDVPYAVTVAIIASVVIFLCFGAMVFPVLSHFICPFKKTIKNGFLMSMYILPKTLLMIVLYVVPLFVMDYIPRIAPLSWLFWFTFPAYISALLYNKPFKKLEPEKPDTNDDFTWSVNSDLEGEPEDATSEEGKEDSDESVEAVAEISETTAEIAETTAEISEATAESAEISDKE